MIVSTILIAAATAAATTGSNPTVQVSSRGLDLAREVDRRVLDLRIARAASAVCDGVDPRYGGPLRVAQKQCRESTIRTVRAKLTSTVRFANR